MAVLDRQRADVSKTLHEVAVTYASAGLFTGYLHSNDPQPIYEYTNEIACVAQWVHVMHHGNCKLDARSGLLRVAALAIAAVRELDNAAKQSETPNAPHEGPGAASSRTVPLDAVVGGQESALTGRR